MQQNSHPASPARLLEILEFRFGAFEAFAGVSLLLSEESDPEFCPPMDRPTAWAILAFADDLKHAASVAADSARSIGGH